VWLECPYFGRPVELSDSRIAHIRRFHGGLSPDPVRAVAEVLLRPDEVRGRAVYRQEFLFVKALVEGYPFVVVVVVESEPRDDAEPPRLWVVTSYPTHDNPAMGDVLWSHDHD